MLALSIATPRKLAPTAVSTSAPPASPQAAGDTCVVVGVAGGGGGGVMALPHQPALHRM